MLIAWHKAWDVDDRVQSPGYVIRSLEGCRGVVCHILENSALLWISIGCTCWKKEVAPNMVRLVAEQAMQS